MVVGNLLIILCILGISSSDWISDWMGPVQDEFKDTLDLPFRRDSKPAYKDEQFEEDLKPYPVSTQNPYLSKSDDQSTTRLRAKLQSTLNNANLLTQTLKAQIVEMTAQEQLLKDAIVNGRSGVTTIMVSTIGQLPRSYMVREGVWTLCTGAIHPPLVEPSVVKGLFSTPRCFGQEVPTRADPCVFNSVIKYETIPTRRRVQYVEEEFLCLKPSFNDTLEQYMSVPKRIINETCSDGYVRSLGDNEAECGVRVLSEYTYYPNRGFNSPSLPLEYCTEPTGACKLIVAWHVSNSSIENFEFLKNEPNFKNYFIKSDSYVQHVI